MEKYILIFGVFVLMACEKIEPVAQDIKIPDGNYAGTFQRELVWHENAIANISITFTGNKWDGTSDIQKYPALCRGTYSIIGDTIIFENECPWTAEFDWSLILSGKYVFKQTDKGFEFIRDYRSSTADICVDRYIIQKTEAIQ